MDMFDNMDIPALNLFGLTIDEQCKNTEDEMQLTEISSNKFTELASSLLYFSTLQGCIKNVLSKKQQTLKYSVEDIYRYAGQFDKFVIFEFYRYSDAFNKYGSEVYGTIIYQRKQRDLLDNNIKHEDFRSNEIILMEGGLKNENLNILLKSEGFMASDVCRISTFSHDPNERKYKTEGLKEIPNTIPITFNSEGFDFIRLEMLNTENAFKSGRKILDYEWERYYTNMLIVDFENVPEDAKKQYLTDNEKGTLKEHVLFRAYSIWYKDGLLEGDSETLFKTLLNRRKKTRFGIFAKQLGITVKDIEDFKLINYEAYKNLFGKIMHFETETLTSSITNYPIYWDFERFIHIYSRHSLDFYIPASNFEKSLLQYTYKDIRRLICIIIEALKTEIEEKLSQGKPFDKYGDLGYYYNGNYYAIRIDSSGRLLTFHPIEPLKP